MFDKIIAFLMSVVTFFAGLFGIGIKKDDAVVYKNISYGNHSRHKLDLYLPTDCGDDMGLVLYIHGGAWIAGDKEGYYETLEYMAEKYGVACAAVNYRYISDSVTLLDIMDDIDAAMECIRAKGEKHGININRSILTGGSAGGHLSLLYAYSRVEGSAIPPVAVMSDCGPTDLSDDYYYYNEDLGKGNGLGGDEVISQLLTWGTGVEITRETRVNYLEKIAEVSPLTYVNKDSVPTIINHGMVDDIVPFRNAVMLEAKLTELGVEHVFNVYPNSGHGLDRDPDAAARAQELFGGYIEKYVK
ncbi:MAG: alpha/beta hydrolase [Clostridia bacterium]|nr:alpha/beta hydrolase [Clostridia bacterium]MBR3754866.1 alpha/beta hydrolase [Clostridia bacterium]